MKITRIAVSSRGGTRFPFRCCWCLSSPVPNHRWHLEQSRSAQLVHNQSLRAFVATTRTLCMPSLNHWVSHVCKMDGIFTLLTLCVCASVSARNSGSVLKIVNAAMAANIYSKMRKHWSRKHSYNCFFSPVLAYYSIEISCKWARILPHSELYGMPSDDDDDVVVDANNNIIISSTINNNNNSSVY